ncbi:uncharacterized protein [Physcomitrium patens]|uniref:Kinesin motor domain-containing protein n=1 Tax=Physcomitrium patens TaxID=3218 RepID=A0A2K1KCG1_PHYPA|nr:kinesin-like protein KIN-12F isoform X1 [Physcomitrium patens]PNR51451.1 hypothetical protein PHYPA_010638 [Physcomitrium patens]|eukprot:XP_024380241.1 kinesin-like protein KIN-12F isoform X1 [Physcomitrella patens]
MTSRATSPRRSGQFLKSHKGQDDGADITLQPVRLPLRSIPEATLKTSSTSEKTEPDSPSRPSTPRGKKRGSGVFRGSENVDSNIASASNTPEKPREKRTTLTRVSKVAAAWPPKLPSIARSLHDSLQQTDSANRSSDSDSASGTPTAGNRTPAVSTSTASKVGSIDSTPRTSRITGKRPLDSDNSKTWVSSSNSTFTPSRIINRSLRYGATPGSAASIGSVRAPGSARSLGLSQVCADQQISEQQYDIEEDPMFWDDHNVQVILRTRPISSSESALKGFGRCVRQENSQSITWIGQPESRFTFDHVAGEHITQEKLFRVAGIPMVENCMAGYNSCMFCYGQTGSGKTYTMLGDIVDLEHRPSDNRGITPRVFEYLFSRIQKEEESRIHEHLKYVCKCSFLEIFNEQITDLLEPTSTNLQMREGGKKGVYVENLSEVEVESVQDVVHLLLLGAANRKVAATNMNRESSRSHSVFTCTIESKWEFNSMTSIRFGRLNLVDLAGSERQKSSGSDGDRLKEAAHINKSLSTLGLVIMILVDVANGKQRHVPYRDSKLTYLLQDSLGGNSKTIMIANISPSSCCALETLSTLKFAQRAKFIRNNAFVNQDASGDVNGLRQEIQELKEELNRMKRQKSLPLTSSMHTTASVHLDSGRKVDQNMGTAIISFNEQEQSHCSFDSWEMSKSFTGPRFSIKKLEALEAVLAGALRREQEAESCQKRQAVEIDQLTRLVKQREDDNQCSKMLLRFREDKIKRLEALSAGIVPADMYLRQEKDSLTNELQLIQAKVDRNPELTRFAMENIRLMEQLRRFQDFYIGGEREAMADEISNLRDQLLEVLDSKLSLTALTSPQREALAPELASAKREIELLRIEADNYRREVEDCRKNLSSSLEANSRLTKQLDESNAELQEMRLSSEEQQNEIRELRDKVLDIEAIELGYAQHLELISNLKIKLQQSEEKSERDARNRSELNEQLKASRQDVDGLQAEFQEIREAVDATETFLSQFLSTESSLSVAQEMAALVRDTVTKVRSETKEMAVEQQVLLKHIDDAAVAAHMKESEIMKQLEEANSLIKELSSKKEEISRIAVSLADDVHAREILCNERSYSIIQLEQELQFLDLSSRNVCTPLNRSSREELHNVIKLCTEMPRSQEDGDQPRDSCILKLNFATPLHSFHVVQGDHPTSKGEQEVAHMSTARLLGDRIPLDIESTSADPAELEILRSISSLREEIMKLKPDAVVEQKALAKWNVTEFGKELQDLTLVIQAVQEERRNWALKNEALLKEKDLATRARKEWEAANSRLLDYINEGDLALTEAVREMEGILDDSLNQPTATDRDRELERMKGYYSDAAKSPVVDRKDMSKAIRLGDKVKSTEIEKTFASLTIMLRWFSDALTNECNAKDILQRQNEHSQENLQKKDLLISSLQAKIECGVANMFGNCTLISEPQDELFKGQTRPQALEPQAVVDTRPKRLQGIEKHRPQNTTFVKCTEETGLKLVQKQVCSKFEGDLIGCERNKGKFGLGNMQLAGEYAHDKEALGRSCMVAAIMLWWLQNQVAVKGIQKLDHDDIALECFEQDRRIASLQEEITKKTLLLIEQEEKMEILVKQNLKHVQESDDTRKELGDKDFMFGVMQTSILRLQDVVSASEARGAHLVSEKEQLQIQLSDSVEISIALEALISKVQRKMEEADTKVVELATVQAGMFIVQEEWELETGRLVRSVAEAESRCTLLEQELELALNAALKFEAELELAKLQETTLIERETRLAALQSQLHDACTRETQLTQNLEEVIQSKLNIQNENKALQSKTEELIFIMSQQSEEISRHELSFEQKLQISSDMVEDVHRQMNAIVVDLDALTLTKQKLEAEVEDIEHKILHHCSMIEQGLVKAHEDTALTSVLAGERENKLLGEVGALQCKEMVLSARVKELEDALEGSRILLKQKEDEMAIVQENRIQSESKSLQTQEKLRASTMLMKELARSEEQWKLQKEALAAENKRLKSCMACREMDFSSLQSHKERLEKSLKEAQEKENLTNLSLRDLKEEIKVLEKQWKTEREQSKDRFATVNRELVESEELKQKYFNSVKEMEERIKVKEQVHEVRICELESQWNIEREEASNHLSRVSLDLAEVKSSWEKSQLELATTRALLSAADTKIQQLLDETKALNVNYELLLAEQEALRVELSQWVLDAKKCHQTNSSVSSTTHHNATPTSESRSLKDCFEVVKREFDNMKHENENLRAQMFDKDNTIVSLRMDLDATIENSRQVEIELKSCFDERNVLKLELESIGRALTNAKDEVRSRELQVDQFDTELHKVMALLVETEEKTDESAREWRKQIEKVKTEREAAKLCATEKGSEVTMLRRQFEEGQATLQEAEILVNALVRANEISKRDVYEWKLREEEASLQSIEMLSVIQEEISVTMDHVEKCMEVLGSEIHGMKSLWKNCHSKMAVEFKLELDEFTRTQISEIERATEGTRMKLAKISAEIDAKSRLHKTTICNENLHITQSTGALVSLSEKGTCPSNFASQPDDLSARIFELESLYATNSRKLVNTVAELKKLDMEKPNLVERVDMQQVNNIALINRIQELELSIVDEGNSKQEMELEIISLRQHKDSFKNEIHWPDVVIRTSHDALESAVVEDSGPELSFQTFGADFDNYWNETVDSQISVDNSVIDLDSLPRHAAELVEKQDHLLEHAEIQGHVVSSTSNQLGMVQAESDAALDIFATVLERTADEVYDKEVTIANLSNLLGRNQTEYLNMVDSLQSTVSNLRQENELLLQKASILDEENKHLLEKLEIASLQICKHSQGESDVSTAHELQVDILRTIIESTTSELLDKDHIISTLHGKLSESSACSRALNDEKKDLLERLELLSLQVCKYSEEADAISTGHELQLEILRTIIESASSELLEKDHIASLLQEQLEQRYANWEALNDDKKDLLRRLEILSLQLCKQSQEATAASVAHESELESLRTIIESISSQLSEKDHMISALREELQQSSVQSFQLLTSLEGSKCEKDSLLLTVNQLETRKELFAEETEMQARRCGDLEMVILKLRTDLQEASDEHWKQEIEIEILTAMLECAVKDSKEKDALANELENLLSQSQLQNSEMLQSSQEVVNHFSLFQSQLDACFQKNRELEKSKLTLNAEIQSQSQEISILRQQGQASENSLNEIRVSFAELKEQKEEDVRVFSDKFEKMESQLAVMQVDLCNSKLRCEETEAQLSEREFALDSLRGELLSNQEEYKESVVSTSEQLRGCHLRIAELECEKRDLINDLEEESARVAQLQQKIQTREDDMTHHFTQHCIQQEIFDSLEHEKRELQSLVNQYIAEVAAKQQRVAAVENMHVETRLEMEALERDLKQKDDLLQSLESDLNLLQESALQELYLNQEVESMRITTSTLQKELNFEKEGRADLEKQIGQVAEEIVQVKSQAAVWEEKSNNLETELDRKRQIIENLEDELRMSERLMANALEEVTMDLKEVENERDRLQKETIDLTKQLETTHATVLEREAIASELHKTAELSKAHAKVKEDEAVLLSRSVEELESTVYALEGQLGLLNREAERQRLLREDIEMELQKLNNHVFVTQSAHEEASTRSNEQLKDALSALQETERKVEEKDSEIMHLRRKLKNLDNSSKDTEFQLDDAMAQISDLLHAAEEQKADFQQKMENLLAESKSTNWDVQTYYTARNSNGVAGDVSSSFESSAQSFSLGSDPAHITCQSRIKELEELAASRQNEMSMLNTRLAEAESMTHDVLRDLLGVRTDMNNIASMLGHQKIQQLAEIARRKNVDAEEMEAELSCLRSQINDHIEERKSLLEEVNQRQCEISAAREIAEKLRQREQLLTDEIEKFRISNINHQEKIRELETEIRRLPSGHQTFHQQITHHAKIQEENQALKFANEELSKNLRRLELLNAGMNEEVVRHRTAESKNASSTFDEEQRLRHLLREAEDSRAQASRKLSVLSSAILQAAGLSSAEKANLSTAMDALQLLANRLRTAERELSDSKYKMKYSGERRRRTDIRAKDSPLRSISNFTDLLQRAASSPGPAPR